MGSAICDGFGDSERATKTEWCNSKDLKDQIPQYIR
jgi:hypothetical protein